MPFGAMGGPLGAVAVLWLAALAAQGCAAEAPAPDTSRGGDQAGIEGLGGGGLLADRDTEKLKRDAALAGEIAKTLTSLEGVASARVHLVTADRSPLARSPVAESQAVVLLLRADDRGLPEAEVRALVAGAVPGLRPEKIAVFIDAVREQPPRFVQIGPIQIAASSATAARLCLGGLLAACLALALLLVGVGLRLRRLRLSGPQRSGP